MSESLKIFQRVDLKDTQRQRETLLSIVDMVRAKIEEGKVASLVLLMVSKDPAVSGDNAYTGSRFFVHPAHLDLVEDVFTQMMENLIEQYKVTPDELRRLRRGAG